MKMRIAIPAAVLLSVAASIGGAQQQSKAPQSKAHAHGAKSDDLKWGPAPAVFPAGARMAVLQGNPGNAELFTVRLRFPNGYRIAPHTHPTDEHVTVISGHLDVGMGETADPKAMMTLKAGGFVTAPANAAHYVRTRGPTVVQVHAMGPFALTYVNPADMPAAARQ